MRLAGAFDAGCLMSCLYSLLISKDASAERQRVAPRYLVYPPPAGSATKVQVIFGLGIPMEVDASTIVGYVIKANYKLPYNASRLSEAYLRYERSAAGHMIDQSTTTTATSEALPGTERYDIYKIIEAATSSGSRSEGKPCLLRLICEAAATPFNTRHDIFSQLLHVLFTPSSTAEPIDQEYLAAESMGVAAAQTVQCARAFHECRHNFLDYFSRVH